MTKEKATISFELSAKHAAALAARGEGRVVRLSAIPAPEGATCGASYKAQNAPYQAQNAPFKAQNAPFKAQNAPFAAQNAPFAKP